MAVEHIVLMKLREPKPEQEVSDLLRTCEAHFDKIPGIISSSLGTNFKPIPEGYTHAILVRLKDKQALDGYLPHPEHLAAGKLLQSIFTDFVSLDYETDRN
jgi:hypothetical protein